MGNESESTDEYWKDIFPYDAYPDQKEGINKAVETLQSNGVHLLEGPCGTGKTLIALVASLSLIRDSKTPYERVLVITSKKQQLTAFESDVKTINECGNTYYPSLTLVGKSDLCPYVHSGAIDSGEIYSRCIELRDSTKQIMKRAVAKRQAKRDSHVAFGLAARAESAPKSESPNLEIDGEVTTMQRSIPTVSDEEYCPFYAQHIVNSVKDDHPLTVSDVSTAKEILSEGSKCGTCPHLTMREIHEDAEVLLGNYKHAFDPKTVAGLTSGIIDQNTILVADEAHGLVSEVRDQISYDVPLYLLTQAVRELKEVREWANGNGDRKKVGLAKLILESTQTEAHTIGLSISLLEKVNEILFSEISDGLSNKFGRNWKHSMQHDELTDVAISLQDPVKDEPDVIRQWVIDKGYEEVWGQFLKTARVASVIKNIISQKVDGSSPDGSFAIGRVYELFKRWWNGDDIEYFRDISLSPRSRIKTGDENPSWTSFFNGSVRINNNIPQNEIAGTLDAFGGAILMSATLSPLHIYETVTGVNKLKEGTQPAGSMVTNAMNNVQDVSSDNSDGELTPEDIPDVSNPIRESDQSREPNIERARKVGKSEFELGFPEKNRASIAVDVPKFTWTNRGDPKKANNGVRDTYYNAIYAVVRTTPGNVLVCMPSYTEAEWAGELLTRDERVNKEVLVDTSSSDSETKALKQRFVDGPPKVLLTSLRGTLTEGVDFSGDMLSGVAICGVPIVKTSTDRSDAIEASYDRRFDNKGFEYAFTVPAVRKTRQAIGRVIRGMDDVGVRVLIDSRYANSRTFGSVREYFPEQAMEEFTAIGASDLPLELQRFWDRHR